jgi:DNA primase large subunit
LVSLELGVEDRAKYSFLEEAGEYIKERGLSLKEISQPDFKKVLDRARERVFQAIKRGEVSGKVTDPEIEIPSFPIALMLVKASNLNYLISRFSLAEAKRVEKLLKGEREELVVQIFRNILKVDLISVKSDKVFPKFNYRILINDYLKRSIQFHELEWKLVNRVVSQGYVYLRTSELTRLIRQEINDMIVNRLNVLRISSLPDNINEIVKEIIKFSPPPPKIRYLKKIAPEMYPPCVKTALNHLKKGKNLPQYGRFLLATYLVNNGSSVEEVVSLYSKSPDFNERITRYQVEHIAGLRGGRVKYICPSCKTLVIHNFCFRTQECKSIKNPLQFGRQKVSINNEKGKK